MTAQDSQSELDKIFNASPIDEEVPEDIWGTIYPTWTGLWTDGYGEWDEKQPSDIYPLTEILSREAEERLKKAIEAYVTTRVKEAERLARIDEHLIITSKLLGSEINSLSVGSRSRLKGRIEALTTTTNGRGK